MTRAPRSTAETELSAPPSLPNGVRATPASTTSSICRPLRLCAQQPGYDRSLNLAGSFTDLPDLHISPVARDRELLHDSVSAVDLNRVIGSPRGDLGRIELGHAGGHSKVLSLVLLPRRLVRHQPGELDFRRHIGEPE